jgi:sporulation and spore germination protein
MTTRLKIFLLVLIGVLAAGSFYLRALARRIFREVPKQAEENLRAKLDQLALQSRSGPLQTATLYFPSPNSDKLVLETRPITWAATDTDRVHQVLLALIEGSRQGLGRALPTSTSVRGVFLASERVVFVDLSNDILSGITPGISTESQAIYSIVDSITANVPAVKRVRILIQGQEVETLDGHADLSEAYVPDPTRIQTARSGGP